MAGIFNLQQLERQVGRKRLAKNKKKHLTENTDCTKLVLAFFYNILCSQPETYPQAKAYVWKRNKRHIYLNGLFMFSQKAQTAQNWYSHFSVVFCVVCESYKKTAPVIRGLFNNYQFNPVFLSCSNSSESAGNFCISGLTIGTTGTGLPP